MRQPTCPKGKPDHFWEVEQSGGATSESVCKYCKEKRTQKNSFETEGLKGWRIHQPAEEA